jgi:hypothetical protein
MNLPAFIIEIIEGTFLQKWRLLRYPSQNFFYSDFEQKVRIISLKMTEAVKEEIWVGS